MLKPSGGFLKKIFGGVNKAVKKVGGGVTGMVKKTGGAVGSAVGKVGGALPGPTPPGFRKKKPVAVQSRLAPGGGNPMGSVTRNKQAEQ